MKIGKILNSIIKESLVKEERMNISHLNESTVLIIYNNKLTLYDVNYLNSESPIDGVIGFSLIGYEDNQPFMEMVAAKKGYGPLMYELSMQYVSPNSLIADIDGNTSQAALKMWDYFFNGNNSDVEVEPMENDDPLFRPNISDNPQINKLFNTRYYLNDLSDLYYLEARTEEFLDELDNPREVTKKIMFLGNDFFNKMY